MVKGIHKNSMGLVILVWFVAGAVGIPSALAGRDLPPGGGIGVFTGPWLCGRPRAIKELAVALGTDLPGVGYVRGLNVFWQGTEARVGAVFYWAHVGPEVKWDIVAGGVDLSYTLVRDNWVVSAGATGGLGRVRFMYDVTNGRTRLEDKVTSTMGLIQPKVTVDLVLTPWVALEGQAAYGWLIGRAPSLEYEGDTYEVSGSDLRQSLVTVGIVIGGGLGRPIIVY